MGEQVPGVELHRADEVVGVAERVLRIEAHGARFQHVAGDPCGALAALEVPGIRNHGIPLPCL